MRIMKIRIFRRWQLKVTFRAVSMVCIKGLPDGSTSGRDIVHDYEETLQFWTRSAMETHIQKNSLRVTERRDDQKLVVADDNNCR